MKKILVAITGAGIGCIAGVVTAFVITALFGDLFAFTFKVDQVVFMVWAMIVCAAIGASIGALGMSVMYIEHQEEQKRFAR